MKLLWTKKLLNGHRNIDARSADTSSVEQSIHRAKKYPAQTAETPTIPHDLVNKANMFIPDISQKTGSSIFLARIVFLRETSIAETVNHAAPKTQQRDFTSRCSS